MTDSRLKADVAALRAFNRLYTSRLGLLNDKLDGSPFPLTEARVLYELANTIDPTAARIGRALGLDKAQLSRILKRFAEQRLLTSVPSPQHAKHQLLSLTERGSAAFKELDAATNKAAAVLLQTFSETERRRLLQAADAFSKILRSRS